MIKVMDVRALEAEYLYILPATSENWPYFAGAQADLCACWVQNKQQLFGYRAAPILSLTKSLPCEKDFL